MTIDKEVDREVLKEVKGSSGGSNGGRRATDNDSQGVSDVAPHGDSESCPTSIVDIDVAVGDKHIDVNVKTYPALVTIGIVIVLIVLLPLVVACTVNSGDVIHANQYNGVSQGQGVGYIGTPTEGLTEGLTSSPVEGGSKDNPHTTKEDLKEYKRPNRNTMFILASPIADVESINLKGSKV